MIICESILDDHPVGEADYSLLYHPDYYKKAFAINHFSEHKLGYKTYRNAIILPAKETNGTTAGGVVTESGDYLGNTALHDGSGAAYSFEKPNLRNEKAIYLGMFLQTWGHCLTDNIRRLWFLNTDDYRENYADWKLIYIPYPHFSFSKSFRELLKILGFDCNKFEPIRRATCFQELLIPDESFYTIGGGPRFFTKEYKDMIDHIRSYAINHRVPCDNEKIYFTYSGFKKGKQTGEEKLERFFSSLGYTIISPEKYPFAEQLNYLINAKEFASTIGSCSHNMMFLQDHSTVTLIPRANYLTGYQRAIDDLHDQKIRYVDSSLSIYVDDVTPWAGPFFFFISKNLCKAFDVMELEADVYRIDSSFRKYCRTASYRRDLSHCGKAVAYYLDELIPYADKVKRHSVQYRIGGLVYKTGRRLKVACARICKKTRCLKLTKQRELI